MNLKTFAFGFFTALFLIFIWKFVSGKVSFYDASSVFTANMTPEQAKKAFDDTQAQIQSKYNPLIDKANQTGGDASSFIKQSINDVHDLSNAYNIWLVDHAPPSPPDGLPAPTPGAAPAAAPAPSQ